MWLIERCLLIFLLLLRVKSVCMCQFLCVGVCDMDGHALECRLIVVYLLMGLFNLFLSYLDKTPE